MPGLEQIDPRKLWKNYVIALTLIFSMVSISHFSAWVVGGDTRQMASDINSGGGQRMLSQRVLYFATAYQQSGYANEALAKGLHDALVVFERTHDDLVQRATEPRLNALYFGEGPDQNLDKDVQRFLADAHVILAVHTEASDTYVADLQSFGPGPLLRKLDAAAHLYEDLAHENAVRAEWAGMAGYALAVAALIFEAIYIFRPSHSTIVRAFEQLEETQETLKNREKDAFLALEEAEEAWAEAEESRINIEQSHDLAKARMANAGYELAGPLAALRVALDDATMAPEAEDRAEATRDALTFADLTDELCTHLMRAAAEPGAQSKQCACDLRELVQLAVGTVAACGMGKPPIVLSLPPRKPPALMFNSLALFRALVHLLRDAQDVPGSGRIRLALEAEQDQGAVSIGFTLTQPVTQSAEAHSYGVEDKQLSEDEVRAAVLKGLVADLEGAAAVTHAPEERKVSLRFQAAVHRPRAGVGRKTIRRAG